MCWPHWPCGRLGVRCHHQETRMPHTPPSPEAGLAQPTEASLRPLCFLEASWETLPSVLTMFWVFRLVCGSHRRLQGVGGSWLLLTEGPFLLPSAPAPGAGLGAHHTGWRFPVGPWESA